MELINEGKTVKEVAQELGVKNQRVYDVKNGKAQKKATADLRVQA
ncbi:hypothetical protein [Alteribacter populi]|nr:hypothetical protein [Alteribacter populi]